MGTRQDYMLAPSIATSALDRGMLEVYDVRGGTLRNITSKYGATLRSGGDADARLRFRPLTTYLLGPEWYPVDVDHRWMPKRATLRMGAPFRPERRLYLTAYRAAGLAPPKSRYRQRRRPATRGGSPGPFEIAFALPDSIGGSHEMLVAIEASKTFRPPSDSRDLSLSFGVFEMR